MKPDNFMIPAECPYCGSKVEYKDSEVIYHGKSYGMMYICSKYPECKAYVSVHKGTTIPMGTLANEELRALRKQCHALFDTLWKDKKSRNKSYDNIGAFLKLPKNKTHMAMLNLKQCTKLLEHLKFIVEKRKELKKNMSVSSILNVTGN